MNKTVSVSLFHMFQKTEDHSVLNKLRLDRLKCAFFTAAEAGDNIQFSGLIYLRGANMPIEMSGLSKDDVLAIQKGLDRTGVIRSVLSAFVLGIVVYVLATIAHIEGGLSVMELALSEDYASDHQSPPAPENFDPYKFIEENNERLIEQSRAASEELRARSRQHTLPKPSNNTGDALGLNEKLAAPTGQQ